MEKLSITEAVMSSCNLGKDDAWKEIRACRQNFEENITSDPARYHEYIEWALEELGVEMDYAEEFLENVPYEPVEADEEYDEAEGDNIIENLDKLFWM